LCQEEGHDVLLADIREHCLREGERVFNQVTDESLVASAVRPNPEDRVDSRLNAVQVAFLTRYVIARQRPTRKVSGLEAAVYDKVRGVATAGVSFRRRPAHQKQKQNASDRNASSHIDSPSVQVRFFFKPSAGDFSPPRYR
jgi:hypothetical protein